MECVFYIDPNNLTGIGDSNLAEVVHHQDLRGREIFFIFKNKIKIGNIKLGPSEKRAKKRKGNIKKQNNIKLRRN